MKKMGPFSKILEMLPGSIPGLNSKDLKGMDMNQGEKEMKKVEAMIQSMSSKERKNPNLVISSSSRKKRITKGSGTTVQDLNRFLKQFEMMRKMMKQQKDLLKPGKKGMFGKLPF
jgi:signal recognition particle subunit SRP54